MIISNNDEAKRSRLWRVTILVTSALIIIIAVYLLTKMFTTNPLEGTWESEDGGFTMEINGDDTVTVGLSGLLDGEDAYVKMDYSMDKDAKTITIEKNAAQLDSLAEKAGESYTREELESELAALATTFDYNVEAKRLTLTEREYGGQLTFTKK